MKQIGLATQMYSSDYADWYPMPYGRSQWSWNDVLGDYDGRHLTEWQMDGTAGQFYARTGENPSHQELYWCPSDNLQRNWANVYPLSYSLSRLMLRANGTPRLDTRGILGSAIHSPGPDSPGLQTAKVRDPSQTLIMSEYSSGANVVGGLNNESVAYPNLIYGKTVNNQEFFVHQREFRMNFMAADGHLEYMFPFLETVGPSDDFGDLTDSVWDCHK